MLELKFYLEIDRYTLNFNKNVNREKRLPFILEQCPGSNYIFRPNLTDYHYSK